MIIRLELPDWGNPHDDVPWPEQVLTDGWSPVPGLSWQGDLTASIVRVSGHIGFQIEGAKGTNDKFLLAVAIKINGDEVYRASTNVRRDQHYVNWPINAMALVDPELHEVVIYARAHLKDGSPDTKICYKEPHYTAMWIEVA